MGLKKNIVYSSILTVSGYIFPFLTFPYVTRVLGVEHFGVCSFFDSIIAYFTLFSMMGMATLGIREIAKCNGDKEKLNKTYSSLFFLNFVSTFISIAVLLLSLFFVDRFQESPKMIYIGCLKIVSNFLLVEWFYRGIENFKFITFRSILIRTLYVVMVFVLVREPEDYVLYFLLTALMFTVNAVINMIYSRNFVQFSLHNLEVKHYIKPFVIFGAYQLLTSMYTSFNVAYLGFTSGNIEVGYYSASVKLFNILLSFYTAFTGVLLPRMSALALEGDSAGFSKLLSRSFNILLSIAIPIVIISEVFAPEIVNIMSGGAFGNSVTPMRIVMPLLLIIGVEQILVYQVLIPLNQDKQVFINSTIGATVGIIANIILVPYLASIGSAIVWLLSELTVFTSTMYFARLTIRKINIKEVLLNRGLAAAPITISLFLLRFLHPGIKSFALACIIIVIYYGLFEIFIVEDSEIRNQLLSVINKRK